MTHTREQLSEITQQWVGLWNQPVDWALYERLHSPQFKDHSSAGRGEDKAGFAQSIVALLEVFPDLHTQVDDVVVDLERGRVAVRWSAQGTNVTCYLGVGPTHRQTRITGIEIIDIECADNASTCAIVRRWGEWDITDHLRG